MMSRRASPSARTTRIAPTAPCVPVGRDRRVLCLGSVPPDAGPVTGSGSCTSVEGGSERSTGSLAGPAAADRDADRSTFARAARRSSVGVGLVALALAVYCARPSRTATTTTSSGRRWPFLEGQAAIRYPVARPATASPATPASRTSCRSPTSDGVAARPAAVPAAAGGRCCCRSSRSGAWRPTTRLIFAILARDRRRRCAGGCSGGCRSRPASALATTRLLRLRDGVLVRGPARRRPGTRPTSWRSD